MIFSKIISSRRKLFILLYGGIFLFFGSIYLFHLLRLGWAAADISLRESQQTARIENEIKTLKAAFEQSFPDEKYVFTDLENTARAYYYQDTVIKTFVFWNTLSKKSTKVDFVQCLKGRAESEAQRIRANEQFEKELNILRQKYGSLVDEWVNKIGRHKFMNARWDVGCSGFEDRWTTYDLKETAIRDFDRFLAEYSDTKRQVEYDSQFVDDQYVEELSRLKEELTKSEFAMLEQQLKETPALKQGAESFQFESSELGSFSFSIPSQVIDRNILNDALEIVFNEHYKDYSLPNGYMPYGYCYGKRNSGASSIEVNAGNSDVIVLVKNEADKVIRHAYVQANQSFKLNVPNGVYQVNFYHGKGWNPRKKIKQLDNCNIIGGFIYYENLNKDPEKLYLFNQGISYTLRMRAGGNFSAVPSSVGEAF
jgi:hypothetical protein